MDSSLAAAAAAGSAWLGPAGALTDPAEAGLRAAAARYAPGMSPDGQVAKGNLAEGGHIGFIANMELQPEAPLAVTKDRQKLALGEDGIPGQ